MTQKRFSGIPESYRWIPNPAVSGEACGHRHPQTLGRGCFYPKPFFPRIPHNSHKPQNRSEAMHRLLHIRKAAIFLNGLKYLGPNHGEL